jgi:hypothetical protein
LRGEERKGKHEEQRRGRLFWQLLSNIWRRDSDSLVLTMNPSVVEAKNTAPVSTAGDKYKRCDKSREEKRRER